MNTIYIITGPAGVGKSTVSAKIAERLEKSVLIEGDDIYNMVVGGYVSPWKDGNHLEFFWKNVKNIMQNALDYGYDVVFNYIIKRTQIEDIRNTFIDINIKFVCLMTDLESLKNRDKLRPLDCQMGDRCKVLLENFTNEKFNTKFILNTSNFTAEETFKEIINNDKFFIQNTDVI